MKFYYYLTLFCIFFNSNALAQTYKYNGRVITDNYDTIEVIIKKGFKHQNEMKVTYREANKKGEFKVASPSEIIAFSHKKESYKVYKIDNKSVFLRDIVIGYFSLFEKTTVSGEPVFYLYHNDQFTRLDKNKFHEQLYSILNSCETKSFKQALDKVRYNQFLLANLISSYNACVKPEKYVSVKYKPEVNLRLSGLSGIGFSDVEFVFLNDKTKNETLIVYPFIGLDLLISTSRRVNFGISSFYSKYEMDINFEEVLTSNVTDGDEIRSYKVSKLAISPYLRLKPIDQLNLFIKTGPIFEFLNWESTGTFVNEVLVKPNTLAFGINFGTEYHFSRKISTAVNYNILQNYNVFFLQEDSNAKNFEISIRYYLN